MIQTPRRLAFRNFVFAGHQFVWVIFFILLGESFGADVVRLPVKGKGAGPLFQIRDDEKWGYIDRTGRVVLRPEFDDEGDFFNRLARVRKGAKWGYIDESGHVAIPYRYDS